MRLSAKSVLLSAGILLAAQVSASAATYLYSYTGTDGSFSFKDSSSPSPAANIFGIGVVLDETGTYNGVSGANFAVTFGNSLVGGGFSAGSSSGPGLFFELGPQLYSDNPSTPSFAIQKTSVSFAQAGTSGIFTVADTTTSSVSAVPEPSTWAMMLFGLGGLGFLAYRKGRQGNAGAAMLAA